MLQAIPSFPKNSGKSLFISANAYEKYFVCKDYCIVHHDDTTCFLPACKYHFILLGKIEELLHKLDTFYFNTSTVYIRCSSTDLADKLLQRVDLCLTMFRGQSLLTKDTEGWTKCRVLQTTDSCEESLIIIL